MERVGSQVAFSSVFCCFREGPTLDPLAPAQSKRMSALFLKNSFLTDFGSNLSSKSGEKTRKNLQKRQPKTNTKKTQKTEPGSL